MRRSVLLCVSRGESGGGGGGLRTRDPRSGGA